MKNFIRTAFFLIAIQLVSQTAQGATTQFYLRHISNASDVESFEHVFHAMVIDQRNARIKISGEDVLEIVRIAKAKPFADNVLQDVFGWAVTMFNNEEMDLAISFFLESALYYAKNNRSLNEALSYYEIAHIQYKGKNYREATEYYRKALHTGKDSLALRIIINCYNGLGLIHREARTLDSAMYKFKEALIIADSTNDTAWKGILYGNIGSLYLLNDLLDSAKYYYQLNLQFIKRVYELENLIEAYVHMGQLSNKWNKPQEALLYLDSATSVIAQHAVKFNDYFFNPQDYINETYAEAYAKLGNKNLAYDYLQKYFEISKQKQAKAQIRSVRQIQLTQEFEKQQQELGLLQKINEANLATINQQRLNQIAYLVIIILISLIAFFTSKGVTKLKELNRKLVQQNEELDRLNRIKNKLFSVISHDLRAPLSNLYSLLGLLKTNVISRTDFDDMLDRISMNVKGCSEVLDNLFQWARVELNEHHRTAMNVDVEHLVNRIYEQNADRLQAKNISFSQKIQKNVMVSMDENQLEIILRNVITNAIKFTREGGVINVEAIAVDGKSIITVTDNGVGMSQENIDRLFLANHHFTTLGTMHEKGTGIGLLISHDMVKKNKGDIQVESVLGKGTSFRLIFPNA
jgi:signal transduction histidine kinase